MLSYSGVQGGCQGERRGSVGPRGQELMAGGWQDKGRALGVLLAKSVLGVEQVVVVCTCGVRVCACFVAGGVLLCACRHLRVCGLYD